MEEKEIINKLLQVIQRLTQVNDDVSTRLKQIDNINAAELVIDMRDIKHRPNREASFNDDIEDEDFWDEDLYDEVDLTLNEEEITNRLVNLSDKINDLILNPLSYAEGCLKSVLENLQIKKRQKDFEEYSQNPISIESINPAEISVQDMPKYLDLIAKMEKWFRAVRAYAEKQAIDNGVQYEGYELRQRFKYSDTKAVMKTIKDKYPELYDSCVQLKAISYIKKQLGEENFNSSIASLVEPERRSLEKIKKRE